MREWAGLWSSLAIDVSALVLGRMASPQSHMGDMEATFLELTRADTLANRMRVRILFGRVGHGKCLQLHKVEKCQSESSAKPDVVGAGAPPRCPPQTNLHS